MNTSTPLPIFLSCGATYNSLQETFVTSIEAHLRSHGCTPQTAGRSAYSARQPVEAARALIGACHGAVVIAFERTRILTALEKPDSPEQKDVRDERHPTVWNQMEAAMAYAQKVPMLMIVETGLKRQGMLSDRLEWMAMETDLSPSFLTSEQFRQVFAEWLNLVRQGVERNSTQNFDPAELKLGRIISQLNAKQAATLLLAIVGAAGGIATLSFKAGQEWQQSTKPALQSASPPGSSIYPSLP
jgi:hypothetical protein